MIPKAKDVAEVINLTQGMGAPLDGELISGLCRGETDALSEIYRRYSSSVYGLLRSVLRTTSQADDVIQEVFLRLWHEPERYDPTRGSLKTFLMVSAHRKALDLIRSESARQRREDLSALEDARQGRTDPEVDRIILSEALGNLDEHERKAIELAYFGGHTYKEVAEILAQPEGTVKSRIRSGLGHIKEQLTVGIGGTP